MNYHVIQRRTFTHRLTVTCNGHVKQETALCHIFTSQNLPYFLFNLIWGDVGEEAEPASINTEKRHAVLREGSCSAKQAAITTDNDDQIAELAKFIFARNTCSVVRY
ncbi:hypothetical protein Maes01_02668 [Microbulbifer aestuariivivens]|uniref:Uncharacterized protein n=1 Tax=Microbulbifer aestuariivivens TaxID=1908308 RepID=A0ABP9WSN5_9GAMM